MVDNTKWVDKRNTNEPQKKHSFFGWSLDAHKKDLLDFRYNTQEEIDKLNEEMPEDEQNIENENLDVTDEEIIKWMDEKEAESNLETDLQWIDNSPKDNWMNDNYDEIYKKENSPIEWEIVENVDEDNEKHEDISENNWDKSENFGEENQEQDGGDIKDDDINDVEETENGVVDEKNIDSDTGEDSEESDSVKFFDPFEIDLDEEDDDDQESNEEHFDPFGVVEKENMDDESGDKIEDEEISDNSDAEEDEENNIEGESNDELEVEESENIPDEDNEEDDNEEIEEGNDDEIENGEEPEVENVSDENDEPEDDIDEENMDDNETSEDDINEKDNDEAEDNFDGETEGDDIIDEEVDEWNESEESDDWESTESDDIEEEINENLDEEWENIEFQDSEDEEDEEEEKTLNNKKEEDEENKGDDGDKVIINTPIRVNPNKKDEKNKTINEKKVKKNSSTWEIVTDEEIQLEQWQDMPVTEDDEDYQPSDEELFEREPESFADDELSQQFIELVQNVRWIFKFEHKNWDENPYFKIIWWKTNDSTLEYLFYLIEEKNEPIDLYIKKVEINKEEDEDEHLVQFSYDEDKELNIFVDEVILYERVNKSDSDSAEYSDTKAIFEKFIFLTQNYYDELKAKYNEERRERQKKKQLQQIFKGF